jgi:UDP-N-acetylmuramate dehydrogenase
MEIIARFLYLWFIMLIKSNFCLKPFNTFGIEVEARQAAMVTSVTDLQELFDDGHLHRQSVLILGEGSNVLFTGYFEGLVLLNQIRRKKIIRETDDHIFLQVNGGEFWSSLVDYTVEQGWGGLENLSLIPGTVGAAPVQNIGAYGVELKDVMHSLQAFDMQTGKVVCFDNKDCAFAYRNSIFKQQFRNRFFILNVTFQLDKLPSLHLEYGPLKAAFASTPKDEITLKQVSELVKTIRRSKLPAPEEIKNAGSFFKNPVVDKAKLAELQQQFADIPAYKIQDGRFKLAAGWLIEQCGWKGKRLGDAGVYEKQSLVLVNFGNASGKDILALATSIRKSVKQNFGVDLEMEVNVV